MTDIPAARTTPAGPLALGTHDVEIDGLNQRYHVAGNGPVCLAHPGGPGIWYDYLRMPEAEKHLTMVYVEPVGTGGSDRLPSHPDGYTLDRYVRALDGLREHLSLPRVYLLGHSHGGFVAQRYAITHPDRLAGIILSASSARTGPEWAAAAGQALEKWAAQHAGDPERKSVLTAWETVASLADDEDCTRAVRGLIPFYTVGYWQDKRTWKGYLESLRCAYVRETNPDGSPLQAPFLDDREALRALTVPALIVAGQYDPILGPRWGRELADLIPDSTVAEFAHSGHLAHLEQPAEFADAVSRFAGKTHR